MRLPITPYRVRSYVPRGRMTPGQERAHQSLSASMSLTLNHGMLDFAAIFARHAPVFLEIGFGSGQSLLETAKQHPDKNFIGVETHQPGIGSLFLGMQASGIDNIRVFYCDVIDVLEKCIPTASLAGVQIFFPDPWPKRRHIQRRLIQPAFIDLLCQKLQPGASLHLATDWEDYARHMLAVITAEKRLENIFGSLQFASRSVYRPIVTKFERRAIEANRKIFELQFKHL